MLTLYSQMYEAISRCNANC